MGFNLARITSSPDLVRVLPYILIVLITAGQGQWWAASSYYLYAAKIVVGAWLILAFRSAIKEMRWVFSWEAVVAGIAVFVIWVGLDGYYPLLMERSTPWNPFVQFGEGSALAWTFVVIRILGSSLVVPPIEEVCFRSYIYRWIIKPEFQEVPLTRFSWKAFLLTSIVFGLIHFEWVAGILCGFAYQGLVLRKGRLGDAITAHAITNALLGIWVVWKGAWQFW